VYGIARITLMKNVIALRKLAAMHLRANRTALVLTQVGQKVMGHSRIQSCARTLQPSGIALLGVPTQPVTVTGRESARPDRRPGSPRPNSRSN
jgi:chloramphenicol 3-O-phosphotransferase